jgi:hypothetical protein
MKTSFDMEIGLGRGNPTSRPPCASLETATGQANPVASTISGLIRSADLGDLHRPLRHAV